MFHVGQKIVCINDEPSIFSDISLLVKGIVYTVKENYPDGVVLVEIPMPPSYWWFGNERFRPVHENKSDTSFTTGADPDSDRWDNRVKRREKV